VWTVAWSDEESFGGEESSQRVSRQQDSLAVAGSPPKRLTP
jgi:hypothetical protein